MNLEWVKQGIAQDKGMSIVVSEKFAKELIKFNGYLTSNGYVIKQDNVEKDWGLELLESFKEQGRNKLDHYLKELMKKHTVWKDTEIVEDYKLVVKEFKEFKPKKGKNSTKEAQKGKKINDDNEISSLKSKKDEDNEISSLKSKKDDDNEISRLKSIIKGLEKSLEEVNNILMLKISENKDNKKDKEDKAEKDKKESDFDEDVEIDVNDDFKDVDPDAFYKVFEESKEINLDDISDIEFSD